MSLFNEKPGETDQSQTPALQPRRTFLHKGLLTGAGAAVLATAGAVGMEQLGTLPTHAAPAAPHGDLNIIAVDTSGVIWMTIRHANGTWEGAFGNVNQQEANGASLHFVAASCATDSTGIMHVVAVDTSGSLWYTFRNPDGTWFGVFGSVSELESNGSLQLATVSCMIDTNGDLNVIAVDKTGTIWMTIRQAATGNWLGGFGDVSAQELNGANLRFVSVSAS